MPEIHYQSEKERFIRDKLYFLSEQEKAIRRKNRLCFFLEETGKYSVFTFGRNVGLISRNYSAGGISAERIFKNEFIEYMVFEKGGGWCLGKVTDEESIDLHPWSLRDNDKRKPIAKILQSQLELVKMLEEAGISYN
jgi:hypothetical protein